MAAAEEIIIHTNEGRIEGVYSNNKALKVTVIDQDDDSLDQYIVSEHTVDASLAEGKSFLADIAAETRS